MTETTAANRVSEQEAMRVHLFGRIMRRQFAHAKPRRAAVVTHHWVWKDRSKYVPHQGTQEMQRRQRQRNDLILRTIEAIDRQYGDA